jgi:hypothetical protein
MTVLEKDANDEQRAVEKARRVEEERMTQQEKLYQVGTAVTSVAVCHFEA